MKYLFGDVQKTANYLVTEASDGRYSYFMIGNIATGEPPELFKLSNAILQRLKNEIGTHIFADKFQAIAIADKAQREYDYTVSAM